MAVATKTNIHTSSERCQELWETPIPPHMFRIVCWVPCNATADHSTAP